MDKAKYHYLNMCLDSIDGETWNDIPGYDGMYAASNLGRVMSVERVDNNGRLRLNMIRKQTLTNMGELGVPLYDNFTKRAKFWTVGQLVWMAFNGYKPNEKMKIAHRNKDSKDNRLCNLECCYQKKIVNDTVLIGKPNEWRMQIAEYATKKTFEKYKEYDLDNGNRICTRCFIEKPMSLFSPRSKDSVNGRNRICRDCQNKQYNERYANGYRKPKKEKIVNAR